MTDHVKSYYAATANKQDARAALSGDVTADICIIGAGFTGCAAALELAERGAGKIVVLEAVRVGFGASGRNGGQIVNGYSRNLDVLGDRYGEANGRFIAGMANEGGDIIRERVAKYNIACDLLPGMLATAMTAKQMHELEHHVKVWNSFGFDQFELLDKNGLAPQVVTNRYVGGLIDKKGGHLHPLNLVQGEAAAFESLGGTIYENSPVVSVDLETATVRTAGGTVQARTVLVCGNAYLQKVLPQLEMRVMPVSTQVLATQPLGAEAARLLPSNVCVEDCNYVLDYFRRTADGRILYGGGINYGGADPASIRGAVIPKMLKTFPSLKDARIDYAWSGNFALTMTRFPQMGQLSPNVYFSHGDSGHGVTTTHLLGHILAEAVTGNKARYDVFSALPYFPFPGGKALRVPFTALGAWYYGLRDKLGV